MLLADVFENLCKTFKITYNFDRADVFSAPGLSFDVIVTLKDVELELFTDIDMHFFIESEDWKNSIYQMWKHYFEVLRFEQRARYDSVHVF